MISQQEDTRHVTDSRTGGKDGKGAPEEAGTEDTIVLGQELGQLQNTLRAPATITLFSCRLMGKRMMPAGGTRARSE